MSSLTSLNRAAGTFDVNTASLTGRWLVEASAGTGKTYALEHIVLRLVIEKAVAIDRVLLVTFTNAATAELRERVRALFYRAAAALRSGDGTSEFEGMFENSRAAGHDAAALLQSALEQFDEASILTIHGFCQKMLSEFIFTRGGAYDVEFSGNTGLAERVVEEFLASPAGADFELDRAERTAYETSAEHQQPVDADHHSGRTLGDAETSVLRRARHVEVGGIRYAHLDADIDEYADDAEDEVAERKCRIACLSPISGRFVGYHERLRYVGQVEHHERKQEYAHRKPQCRGGALDGLSGAHQVTAEHRNYRRTERIERTAELHELVTAVAASSDGVEHRVDHRVEHAHRETADEGAHDVYRETLHAAAQIYHRHSDEADGNGRERRTLVADALEHHSGRKSHKGICDEVGRIAELRLPVGEIELLLHDYSERVLETRDEGNHEKECEHDDNG